MHKSRLEAFSDGVLAVIITIMVLEMKPPHGAELSDLAPLWPVFLSYLLSFIYLGIYWNNHHHLLQAAQCVNGRILWANLHLLFWLSLIPFLTGWMGENHFARWPVAAYGGVLLAASIAYTLLVRQLMAQHGPRSTLARAIGGDFKGKLSMGLYVAGVAFSFVQPWISVAIYGLVSAIWLVPDTRIERVLDHEEPSCEPPR
jgi:uncharacterized membrane protein